MVYAELTVFLLIRKSCTIKNKIKIVWRNSNLLYSYQKLTSMTIVEVVKYRLKYGDYLLNLKSIMYRLCRTRNPFCNNSNSIVYKYIGIYSI